MRITLRSAVAVFALFATASLAPAQTPAPSASPAASAAPSPTPKLTRAQKKAAKAAAAAAAATPAPTVSSNQSVAGPVSAAPVSTPALKEKPSGTVAPGGGPGMVWVNTKTHVYHQPNSRFYGKTKAGKYLSEDAAKAEGDKPAGHGE